MENHPIPQDVTGFKFKLIGSVTVKQFLYLLGFGILTTVAFVLPLNIFVKVPAMLLFSLIGIGLTFVPIEGRPMDVMLVNFAKAIPSENRFIYRKRGVNLAAIPAFSIIPKRETPQIIVKAVSPQDEKKAILLSRLRNSPFRPDESEAQVLNTVHGLFAGDSVPASPPPILRKPPQEKNEVDKIAEEAKAELAKKEAQEKAKQEEIEAQKRAQIEAQEQVAQRKEALSTGETSHEIPNEAQAPTPAPEKQNPTLSGGFPTLPDVPNIVLGIVRDPRGKTLPNILVEIVDTSGVPVRAFKTNALGQFASATPLASGTYKVYFEDAQKNHEFEVKEITLNGEIFNPLETTSIDAREKLRRELFGAQLAAN